jgi:hypothetical protein
MADIAASDVSYVISNSNFMPGRGYINDVVITFGDEALTVASAGIPLDSGKMGLPVGVIHSLELVDQASGDGRLYKYDKANNKIKVLQGAGFTPSGENSAPVIATADDSGSGGKALSVTTGALSTNGAEADVTGVSAPIFTGDAVAAGAFAAYTGAPDSTSIYLRVEGY